MLCLAALRSGKTTAKVVCLFGPQINPAAAERWKALEAKGVKIEIYINIGDPVPSFAWKFPIPQDRTPKRFTTAWIANTASLAAAIPDALFNSLWDIPADVMDTALKTYGFLKRSSRLSSMSRSVQIFPDYRPASVTSAGLTGIFLFFRVYA